MTTTQIKQQISDLDFFMFYLTDSRKIQNAIARRDELEELLYGK